MASFDIGAKLRQERVGQGLTIDDISRDTRIAARFLEAIEVEDFSHLPGLIFTRNFVRQYALTLKLDPEPLLAELPKHDESTVQLPNPPERRRSSYQRDRRMHSLYSSLVWLLIAGGGGVAGYVHFNRTLEPVQQPASVSPPAVLPANPAAKEKTPAETPTDEQPVGDPTASAPSSSPAPVQVSLTASEAAWVQVSSDGKMAFVGTLKPNETKEISAAEQVKISTGNAGALAISLNGKVLDSIGPLGQVRAVKLTAEGPELLSRVPPPAPDPL